MTAYLPSTKRKSLEPDGVVILHPHQGEFCIEVWFHIALHFAVDILPGTIFIDRFILGIFQTESKIESWNYIPFSYVVCKDQNTGVRHRIRNHEKRGTEQTVDNAEENSIDLLTRQVFLKTNTQHYVLITTKSRRLLSIESRLLRSSLQCTLDTQGIL